MNAIVAPRSVGRGGGRGDEGGGGEHIRGGRSCSAPGVPASKGASAEGTAGKGGGSG